MIDIVNVSSGKKCIFAHIAELCFELFTLYLGILLNKRLTYFEICRKFS